MVHENGKQIVIIRDIQSNFIEEAIFILKSNPAIGEKSKKTAKEAGIGKHQKSDYIIKEAHSIIDNYIKQQASRYLAANTDQSKAKKKWNLSVGFILNIALFVSIALFIFLLSKTI